VVAEALGAERRETLALLADLTRGHGDIVAAALDSNLDDEHDPEGATIAYERAQVDALMAQARHRLSEVAAAEDRLRAGSYGRCAQCGEAVAPARLEARPTARTCIRCAVSPASSRGPSAPA
jgi:DnaK suppressor protein